MLIGQRAKGTVCSDWLDRRLYAAVGRMFRSLWLLIGCCSEGSQALIGQSSGEWCILSGQSFGVILSTDWLEQRLQLLIG